MPVHGLLTLSVLIRINNCNGEKSPDKFQSGDFFQLTEKNGLFFLSTAGFFSRGTHAASRATGAPAAMSVFPDEKHYGTRSGQYKGEYQNVRRIHRDSSLSNSQKKPPNLKDDKGNKISRRCLEQGGSKCAFHGAKFSSGSGKSCNAWHIQYSKD